MKNEESDFQVQSVNVTALKIRDVGEDEVLILTKAENVNGIEVTIGRKAWIPFIIQLPPITILPLQVILGALEISKCSAKHKFF